MSTPEQKAKHWVGLFTDQQKAKFKEDWARGVAISVISDEMGIPQDSLIRLRYYMKLPARKPKGQKSAQVRVNLPPTILAVAKKRAVQRGQYMSAYIRYLIERDN